MGSTTFRALCPKCDKYIPKIIPLLKENKVKIYCNCEYAETIPISEYLSIYKKNVNRKCSYNGNCRWHFSEYKFYCSKCDKKFCEKCRIKHDKGWDIIIMDHLVDSLEIDLQPIRENIEKGRAFINEYLGSLKEKYKSNEVDKAYKECANVIKIFCLL